MDAEVLRTMVRQEVEAALRQEVQSLRRDLRALQPEGPRIADIVGGVGWILGLAGLAVLARRDTRTPSA